jgi:chromosome segregation protein
VLLKSLSLAGFKSFANRTRLEFSSGVNVVVGPNGSGKSNLLDALAWVMGTQAVSSLRTGKMEDVIFAGTATRPRLGRAEVTVTFDNADRFLPLDLAEISMTRRLHRDGTSEYELNGAPCRLMDLHDLLSDGGVGRHQHVLVGQGQIGDILNARPDEHRAVIEEAAGVTKHRSRRDRAVRRLQQTALDVERLMDILDQERRRLRPLKRQANAAERHDAVREEIRALRLWMGGDELRSLRGRLAAAATEKATLDTQIGEDGDELVALRASLSELREAAGDVGRALERDTVAAARLETVAERLDRIAMVARERRRGLESRLEGAGERRRDLEAERAYLEGEIEAIARAVETARATAERRETELQALEDEERTLAEQIQLPAEGVVANIRGDLRALEIAAERDRREAAGLDRRREVVEARLGDERKEADELVRRIREMDVAAVEAQADYEQAQADLDEATRIREEQEDADRLAQLELAHAVARVEVLENAIAGLGDPEARRRAADAAEVLGPVASRLDVPSGLGAAVDGALGQWSDALVATGPDALNTVASQLKGDGLGGVTLVIGRPPSEDVPAREHAERWGGYALVDRLGPAADRGLAVRLLGDVVLVEGWGTAWRMVVRHPHLRGVTPEGDVVTIDGMRLVEPDGAGHATLEAARVALEQKETAAARTASHLVTARREFEAVRRRERSALEVLEQVEARLGGHTEALAINGRSRAEGEAEIVRLDQRARDIAAAGVARSERLDEIRARLAEFEGEDKNRQEAWEALTRRREDVARRRDEARRLREDATSARAAAETQHRLLTTRAASMVDLEETPVDATVVERLANVENGAHRAVGIVRDHIATLRDRQRTLREESGVADARLERANERERQLEARITHAKERLSVLSIEIAEDKVRDEATLERLRRDADADETEALAASRPELDEGVEPDDRLAICEADLRRMGPINPLAAAEYTELSAHVEMVEGQLADLEESRTELRKVISALDDEMATLFHRAFEEISELYQENFALVFPGGRGRLTLTDPDNPLETGVELEAQPLGKKVGRLSLLSGGERSLAALAFLFAVFRARPSPFYVLDEVEAALDDANLRRFLRLVDTLRNSSQLVIITHQQQTMEAADVLYGVTMEPAESSKVVSKRMEHAVL